MTTTVEIVGDSAQRTAGNNATISKRYAVTGASNAKEANDAIVTFLTNALGASLSIGALQLDSVSDDEEVEGVYYGTATWKTFARKTPLASPAANGLGAAETEVSFQVGTQPVRVKVPEDVTVYKEESTADFTPQLIGDVGDGEEPDGVDIYEPTLTFAKTKIFLTSELTDTFIRTIASVAGKTNDATFLGWNAGELLFLGASGSRRGESETEVSYQFQAKQNEESLAFDTITGVDKGGWDYLWPRSETRSSTNAPMVKTITHICVAQVIKSADFNLLELT